MTDTQDFFEVTSFDPLMVSDRGSVLTINNTTPDSSGNVAISIPSSPGDIGAATAAQGTLADSAVQPTDLSTVATSGSYTDLTNKPAIPTQASDIGAVPTSRTVAGHALTADVSLAAGDVSGLSTVATSGSYSDLSNKPTVSTLGAATAAQGALADSAVQPADLDSKADLVGGVVPTSQIPALAIDTSIAVADQAAMLALTSS